MATSPKAVKSGLKPAPVPDNVTALPTAGSRKKFFIVLVGAILLLVAGGGGAWYYLNFFKAPSAAVKPQAKKPAEPPATLPVFLALESFTVNLQSDDMPQFLQVSLTLQVANEAQMEHIKTNMPHVRNRLLLLLSSKKAGEILSMEGKKKLSAEIVEQIRQPFTPQGPSPEVSNVFFTSFVVQ
jgi:flagellar protein FliL